MTTISDPTTLPPRSTANPAPVRPAGSLRRTTSIDVSWPDGMAGERRFLGLARDLWTPFADAHEGLTLAQARLDLRMAEDKTITAIAADPAPAGIDRLVGGRAGGHLRQLLHEVMPELVAQAHPLYLVLDDLSGSALVSGFARMKWPVDGGATAPDDTGRPAPQGPRANVCWGLREGSSGLRPGVGADDVADAEAGDLRNPLDPLGWHALPEPDGAGFRRARRIDVTREGDVLRIDSAFQDSAMLPGGGRVAIHEYLLRVVAKAATLEILSIEPEARILPFRECPGAMANTRRLVGGNLSDIRSEVLAQLRGTDGCTHLNDALRALADVPVLAAALAEGLRRAQPERGWEGGPCLPTPLGAEPSSSAQAEPPGSD
jgi:hypothetical protein